MSEAEAETTSASSRKRSSSRSTAKASEGKVVGTYEDALEAGYFGGPIDEADHTVAGEVAAEEASSE